MTRSIDRRTFLKRTTATAMSYANGNGGSTSGEIGTTVRGTPRRFAAPPVNGPQYRGQCSARTPALRSAAGHC